MNTVFFQDTEEICEENAAWCCTHIYVFMLHLQKAYAVRLVLGFVVRCLRYVDVYLSLKAGLCGPEKFWEHS